jgi:cyclic dehypoxanthinyl futalosine synthase
MGISSEQALDCFRSDDLVGIGMEADAVRRRLHPECVVSYVVERSIACKAIMGGAGSKPGEACFNRIYEAVGETVDAGGTGVRLLTGADRERPEGTDWYEGMFRGIKQRFPSIWIEGLSAAEVAGIAANCGLGLRETIARLRDAGLDSISGNGVDLLGQDSQGPAGRSTCSLAEWLDVHRAAHELGMRTAAVMVFGAGETMEQRIGFLAAVQRLQEETGGFAAFLPVGSEAPGGRELDGVTAVERLKTLAISRMFLDNIENVQADCTGQGLKVLQMGLRFGGNDVGSVTPEGNGASEEDLRRIIRDAGFQPVQRDMAYRTMFLN